MKKLLYLLLAMPCLCRPMSQADIGANNDGGALTVDMTQSTPSGSVAVEPNTDNYNNDLHISGTDVAAWSSNSSSDSYFEGGSTLDK